MQPRGALVWFREFQGVPTIFYFQRTKWPKLFWFSLIIYFGFVLGAFFVLCVSFFFEISRHFKILQILQNYTNVLL